MNKSQLIELIQKQFGEDATKKHAEEALNAVLASIASGIKETGKVQIIGFGTFSSKVRPARTGRNPRTGAPVEIPETTVVHFKASSSLKG